ncbi:MAG: 30S ribosomal protein S5 [Oligoflexia bacterium]|nr:30S ribosomal protein S5 [Oligoflexia bacterium]
MSGVSDLEGVKDVGAETDNVTANETEGKATKKRGFSHQSKRGKDGRRPEGSSAGPGDSQLGSELEERVISVNRCAKVVKGGRRFSFSALLVVGDKNGRIGYGLGKAKEVPEAIRKAKSAAQSKMVKVVLDGGTIPHEIRGKHDAGEIVFRPASEGTGVKAAGACRSILELAGVKNILTKSVRGNNPHNIVKATFNALMKLRSPADIASLRGVDANRIRIK